MSSEIEKLEDKLEVARKRETLDSFMTMVGATHARKSPYKCKRCEMDFYIAGNKGYCLCDNSPWHTYRKTCFVCGCLVSTVFEDNNCGYDYHPRKNQEFVVLDYEQWEDHYKQMYLCENCAKLPYIKLVKNRQTIKFELNDNWDELNSLEREKGNLLRRIEDIDLKTIDLNDTIASLNSDSKNLDQKIAGEIFETKN